MHAYLKRRNNNTAADTEVPPKCPVTTGLLIALLYTGHGKDDLVERVIEIDTHPWLDVPNMCTEEEGASALKIIRSVLLKNIKATLSKAANVHGKDGRKLLYKGSTVV
jgi:hypothetical protein